MLLALGLALRAATPSAETCNAVDGDEILGRHLAAANPYFEFVPADLRIGYVPLPGARRVFSSLDLIRLARRSGRQVDHRDHAPKLDPVCFEYPSGPLDRGVLADLIRRHSGAASVEILELPRFPVAAGTIEILSSAPVSSSPARIFRARVRYGARRTQAFWVRAICRFEHRRVLARAAIDPGHLIVAADLTVTTLSVTGVPPRGTSDPARLTGLTPRKPIPAGAIVDEAQLERPREIARGDLVYVDIRRGNAHVRIETNAESAGRRGETIVLRNPSSGRRFRATVTGRGQVVAGTAGHALTEASPASGTSPRTGVSR